MRHPLPPVSVEAPVVGTRPEGFEAGLHGGIDLDYLPSPHPIENVGRVGHVAMDGVAEAAPQPPSRHRAAASAGRSAARVLASLQTVDRSGWRPSTEAAPADEPQEQLTNRYGDIPRTESGLPVRDTDVDYLARPKHGHAPDVRSHRRRMGAGVRQALASRVESIKAIFARRPRYEPKHGRNRVRSHRSH